MGYLVRLVEANYYESAAWLTKLAGLKVNFATGGWMTLNRGDTDLSSLEGLTGNDCGAFAFLRYEVGRRERTVSLRGVELPLSAVKFGRPKVCTACLREANFYRIVWDLSPFTACPVHEIILLDTCPGCGGRVSWARSKVSCCRCGSDWRDARGVEASPWGVKASRRIDDLYNGVPGASTTGGDKEPLDRLGLGDYCEALCLVADHYWWVKEGKRVTAETENSACHGAFSYAYYVLEEWPHRFEKFLSEYGLGNPDVWPEFKPILQLHGKCRVRALDFMTVALEEFIEHASSLYGGVLCKMPALSKRFVGVRELDRCSNIRLSYLEGLVRGGRIRIFRKEKDEAEEILIDLDSVAKFEEQLASSLTSVNAAQHLGVSVNSVADLVRHGCLLPISGPSVDGLPDWRFNRDEPDRLLTKIRAKVVAGEGQRWRDGIPGAQLLGLLLKNKIGVGLFVRDVLGGNPVPRFMLGGNGLMRFGFDAEEIKEYVYAKGGVINSNEAQSTPNFRLLARTLEMMRKQNEKANTNGRARWGETAARDRVSVNDLAHIARLVLGRAHPTCFIQYGRVPYQL